MNFWKQKTKLVCKIKLNTEYYREFLKHVARVCCEHRYFVQCWQSHTAHRPIAPGTLSRGSCSGTKPQGLWWIHENSTIFLVFIHKGHWNIPGNSGIRIIILYDESIQHAIKRYHWQSSISMITMILSA